MIFFYIHERFFFLWGWVEPKMDLTETEFAIFIYLMLSLRPKDLTNQNLVIIRVLTIKHLHEIIQDINDTQDTKRIKKIPHKRHKEA